MAIVIIALDIPLCANAKDVHYELYSAISEQQNNNPDGLFIIAGDFNHTNLKTVLTKFYNPVNFATRGVMSSFRNEPHLNELFFQSRKRQKLTSQNRKWSSVNKRGRGKRNGGYAKRELRKEVWLKE